MADAPRRRSIEVEGFGHGGQPIPAASRIANVVMTGGISGLDPATHAIPEGVDAQCAQMFRNLAKILAAAGAAPQDVVKLTVYVTDRSAREAVNREWLAMFPDEASRPARHTLVYELPGGMLVQCEAVAVLAEVESSFDDNR